MSLSNTTIGKLASALTPEVIDYIQMDERWVEFLMEIVPDALTQLMGELDADLQVEMSMAIMDNIDIKNSRYEDYTTRRVSHANLTTNETATILPLDRDRN